MTELPTAETDLQHLRELCAGAAVLLVWIFLGPADGLIATIATFLLYTLNPLEPPK